ncbi:hypothetical protein DL96DRAFT_1630926 [Flagelloscypha sp. PMI_526]|nr:hypothetical protein DL96DRAFT_1630926 [Flagelloscypha sp. PMI_526]
MAFRTRRPILFSELPPEIAQTVVGFASLHLQTALALTTTSKSLSQWTVPWLYRCVVLLHPHSPSRLLAALDMRLLSGSPIGHYVRGIIIVPSSDSVLGRDLLPEILTHTTNLGSLTWIDRSPGMVLPRILPPSLHTLNSLWFHFNHSSWPGGHHSPFVSNPPFAQIEVLQLGAAYEWDSTSTILRTVSLAPFTSLQYLSIRSPNLDTTASERVSFIRQILVPQFPSTLKICILYDPFRRFEPGDVMLTEDTQDLIVGTVDDRVVVSTDAEVTVAPSVPFSDFLLRTSKQVDVLLQKRRQWRQELKERKNP